MNVTTNACMNPKTKNTDFQTYTLNYVQYQLASDFTDSIISKSIEY